MILRHEAKLQKRISHSFAYNKQQSIILLLPACIAWRRRDYDLLTGFPRLGKKKNHSRCTSSLRVAEELKTRSSKNTKDWLQRKEKKRGKRVQTTRSQWTKKGIEEQLRASAAGTKVTFNNKYRRAGKVHGASHRTRRLQKSRQQNPTPP